MRESRLTIRITSFALAVAAHALILFVGHAALIDSATLGGGGPIEVGLADVPPGLGTGEEPPPPPMPENTPPPPEEMSEPIPQPEIPPTPLMPDEMVMPDETAEEKPPAPPPQTQLTKKFDNYSTNALSPEEAERARKFAELMGRAGTGRPGKGTGLGAGGGSGGAFTGVGDLQCIRCLKPDYPIEARQLKQEGTVELLIEFNTEGKVETLAIKESSGHFLLDQAAVRTVRKWEVVPRRIAGVPMKARVEQPIIFRLESP